MHNILERMTIYRPFGQPAFQSIQFKTVPNANDTVTIGGDVYTYGVTFSAGGTPVRVAQALCAAINSDISVSYAQTQKVPIRSYTAVYYNDTVVVMATAPGTAGNALTLATSNSGSINLGGSTFGGGTASTAGTFTEPASGTLTDGSGTITAGGTSQQIFAANANRRYLFIANLSTETIYINFTSAAGVATAGSIPIVQNGSFVQEASFVSTEVVNVIGTTTGDKFTAKQA